MTENKQNNPDTVKWMSFLAYFGILFFLPLVVVPSSEEGKFHANQGFTLFLAYLAIYIAARILLFIPIIRIIGGILLWLGPIACLALAIIGMINALNGEQKKLPIIGEYTFIK